MGVSEYYKQVITELMEKLDKYREKYLKGEILSKYSPKFATVIEKLKKYEGTHLIYS